jgi:four helix bundle protein
MLRIYQVALSVIRRLKKLLGLVERRDPDLARQLRRAASSVVLNIAEGSSSQGKNRNARYYNALGSAKEVKACLEVAIAFGYIDSVDDALADELERIIATLINLIV